MSFYFSKNFKGEFGLNIVEYVRCPSCGLVMSATHKAMSNDEWEELNTRVHLSYQGSNYAKDDPRWLERLNAQAKILTNLNLAGVITNNLPWVDYACGDGKLSELLKFNSINVMNYDRYMKSGLISYIDEKELHSKKYANVINTSVFEHFLSREPIEDLMSLIADDGVLSLHTLVRGQIPKDPDWFYLLPVHVTFFTNKSMQILFDYYKFQSSFYNVESRMWFWFRRETNTMLKFAEKNSDAFVCKRGFVDYWKQ
jgi:hypothetical protein